MGTQERVVVIGGSGFIGSSLCRLLVQSRPTKIVDIRASADFPDLVCHADVRDPSQLSRCLKIGDIIVNLAAEHRDDVTPRSRYDEVNVGGARICCNVARDIGINTILFTSSVAVYGFSPPNTAEDGTVDPFNDYGRTKYEAEQVYRNWQAEAPEVRTLIIVRPTVVFGERNRGNVYNLMRQIASDRFIMVGSGANRKSMAYVENVAAFLKRCLIMDPGVHLFNYVDKPDYTVEDLVRMIRRNLGKRDEIPVRLPYWFADIFAGACDLFSNITKKKFSISSIRIKKFVSETTFNTAINNDFFKAPVPLEEAIRRTIHYEFLNNNSGNTTFSTE
jgi:nucleoside-diphosphate-sugar epimerase